MLWSYINLGTGASKRVSDQQIRDAFTRYDHDYPNNDYCDPGHQNWLEEDINRVGAYRWAVWYHGKCYPGKYILRIATGLPNEFYGGWARGQSNYVFNKLGFRVTPRPELGRSFYP